MSVDEAREARPKAKVAASPIGFTSKQQLDVKEIENEFGDRLNFAALEAFYVICECNVTNTRNLLNGYLNDMDELNRLYDADSLECDDGVTKETDFDDGFNGVTLENHMESDYLVSLNSQQLGLTIENILERTVVRSVQQSSEAFRLGVKPNCIITNVGMTSTMSQTHNEALETLKRGSRPLKLVFRHADPDVLNSRRGEMQAYIQKRTILGNADYGAVIKAIEKRTQWLLRMFAIAISVTSNEVPDYLLVRSTSHDTMSFSLSGSNFDELIAASPAPVSRMSMANVGIDEEETPVSDTPMDRDTYNRAKVAEKKIEPVLDLLLCMEKQIFINNRNDVMPYMRLTNMLEFLALFYCELDDSIFTPQYIINMLESDIMDICFSVLQLDLHLIPGNEESASVIPNDCCYNLLQLLIKKFSYGKLKTHAIPMLWKLGTSFGVSAKLTCCNLIPIVYDRLPSYLQLHTRGLLNRLLGDNDSRVRVQVLECICMRLGNFSDMQWVVYCITTASVDSNPLVRAGVFELCLLVLKNTSEKQKGSNESAQSDTESHLAFSRLFPIINAFTEDEDNDIKCLVASKCDVLCKFMGLRWSSIILDVLLVMLRDKDENIRAAAVATTPKLVLNMIIMFNKQYPPASPRGNTLLSRRNNNNAWSEEDKNPKSNNVEPAEEEPSRRTTETVAMLHRIRDNILPPMLRLKSDSAKEVEIALATAVPELLSAICRIRIEDVPSAIACKNAKISIAKVLVAVILELLSDAFQSHDIPYAVLQQLLLSDLSNISSFIFTPSNCALLISSIQPLSTSSNWRMRKSVCSAVPLVVSACKTVETRSQTAAMITPLLFDDVFEVRKCAATSMCVAGTCDVDKLHSHHRTSRPTNYITNSVYDGAANDPSRMSDMMSRPSIATILSVTGGSSGLSNSKMSTGVSPINTRGSMSGFAGNNSYNMYGVNNDDNGVNFADNEEACINDTSEGEDQDISMFEQDMGRMWLDSVILPHLEHFCTSIKYQERLLALHMIAVLLVERIVDVPDNRWVLLLNMALSMNGDRVVNVRIGLVTALYSIMPFCIARVRYDNGEDDTSEGEAVLNTPQANVGAFGNLHKQLGAEKVPAKEKISALEAMAVPERTSASLWLKDVRRAVKTICSDKDRDVRALGAKIVRECALFD